MTTTRAIVALAIIAAVGLAFIPATGGAVAGPFADAETESEASETNATVSTFMQSSAADVEQSVDAEMFAIGYERADDEQRAELVADRTDDLEERLERLEAERDELQQLANSSSDLSGEHQARMARLVVEIDAFDHEIERTKQRAAATGVDDQRLERLQENASDLEGPEIADAARGLGVDRGPGAGERGPPDERGSDETPPGQGSDETPPGQGDNSPPEERSHGQNTGPDSPESADSDQGESDSGNGNGGQSDSGPSDDRGQSGAPSQTGE